MSGSCHYLYPAQSSVPLSAGVTAQTQVSSSCMQPSGEFTTGFTGSVRATTYEMEPTLATSFNAQTQISTTATVSCVTKITSVAAN